MKDLGYDEVEFNVLGKEGKVQPITFNKSNINYYRPFYENQEDLPTKTSLYLSGSEKMNTINMPYHHVKEILNRNAEVYRVLRELSAEDLKRVKKFIETEIKKEGN
jgi:hypothetical protein